MEEEAPTLQLQILKGPREGETLDFKPRTAVRIGRVVKGNNLPIKDAGISTKHLTIVTDSSRWILRDLASSNGTVLDGSEIHPRSAFTLNHDSIIKIGESTSIRVVFVRTQQHNSLQPRRNPARRAQPSGTGRRKGLRAEEDDASVVNEEPERVDPPARVTKRARSVVKDLNEGKCLKRRVQVPSVEKNSASVSNADYERVRVEKVKEAKNKDLSAEEDVVNEESERVDLPARATRVSRRARSVVKDLNAEALVEEGKGLKKRRVVLVTSVEEHSTSLVNEESERVDPPARVTRVSRRARSVVKDLHKEDKGLKRRVQVPSVEENSASVVNADYERVGVEKVEEAKSTWNPSLIEISDCSFGNPVVQVAEEPKRGVSAENVEKKKDVGGKREGEDGNSVREVCDGNWPDLNKMSLGEWFDFLEIFLPKQITDETEEMIESMTKKAERLRKYILDMQLKKQQNDSAKMSLEE
ncbi:hypothetical protein VNO78_16235 [Psophocarpus tetragonolobus]|uniref:FHA domain-containing protein n=1 Tax=Psophocarpus tetragonolobus TaxID=3891 RepID=A0AAN9XKB0_PSOTE